METIWYTVKVEPNCKGHRGEPALSRELANEIDEWIIDLANNGDLHFIWQNFKFLTYEFSTAEMAMAFKLRWL